MGGLIDPRTLLSPRRLDIALKHRFFRHLRDGGDAQADHLYRWHIDQRTGGHERRSWKRRVEDYVTAARDLLAAMQANGFDVDHPIRFGSNDVLMDGAHRLACAVLLDCPVAVMRSDKPGQAAAWDFRWFMDRKCNIADAMQLVRHLDILRCGLDRYHPRSPRPWPPGQLGTFLRGRLEAPRLESDSVGEL